MMGRCECDSFKAVNIERRDRSIVEAIEGIILHKADYLLEGIFD